MVDQPSLLLITRYFPPLNCIATLRMYAWAKYLSSWGWKVSVLTTDKHKQAFVPLDLDTSFVQLWQLPYLDPISLFNVEKSIKVSPQKGGVLGQKLKSFLSGIYRQRMNERLPGRTDPWLIPARKHIRSLKERGVCFDVIISSYGPPSAHLLAHYAKKVFNSPWLADYRDLWIENHVYKGIWPFTLLEKYLEKRIIPKADLLSTVSENLACVLRKKFPNQDTHVIENGFDEDLMQGACEDFFKGRENKLRIVYTGSIYKGKRDPTPLFLALKELFLQKKMERSSIELCFFGASMGNLMDLVKEHGLEDIIYFGGFVSHKDAASAQASADLLLFLEEKNPSIDGNLTGKLFEYLWAKPPILAIGIHREMEAGRLIEKAQAGFLCGNEIPFIKKALLSFSKDISFEKNRQYIQQYSRENQAKRLEGILQEIIKQKVTA